MAPRGKASKRKEPVEEGAEAPAAQPDAQQQERVVRRRVAAAQKEQLQAIEHASHPKVGMCAIAAPGAPPGCPWPRCCVPDRRASLRGPPPLRRAPHPPPPSSAAPSAAQVAGDVFVFGDGDCGQLGQGEDVTERLRPSPLDVAGKKVRCAGSVGAARGAGAVRAGSHHRWASAGQHPR